MCGLNLDLPYCRQALYHLSHQEAQREVPGTSCGPVVEKGTAEPLKCPSASQDICLKAGSHPAQHVDLGHRGNATPGVGGGCLQVDPPGSSGRRTCGTGSFRSLIMELCGL